MIIFFIALMIIICVGMKFSGKNEFFRDYCSPVDTGMVNGVFSVLIFLSHSSGYLKLNSPLDSPYKAIVMFMGQLVVATYLFYSGYGILESYKRKGISYIKEMPFNRLFRTWYHFAIVILLYIVVYMGICGRKYALSHVLLAFTGLTSVGNSNWYMFVTFAMYILLIVAFLVFKKSSVKATAFFGVLVLAFSLTEYAAGLEGRWYNTIFCFPAGMVFSLLKPKIDNLLMKNDRNWGICVACSFVVMVLCNIVRYESVIFYNLFAISGAFLISVLMMKIRTGNKILGWFSNHIFSFFILQRLPMLVMRRFGFNKNTFIFVIISFVVTVMLSLAFDKLVGKLDGIIFKKRTEASKQNLLKKANVQK